MDIQLKASKNVTTLVFYVIEDRLEKAKLAIEEMKPILNKHGFIVEQVRESQTKRPE